MNIEPLDHQEQHSPTEEVLIHETDGKRTTRQYVRRRVSHSRLWKQLDPQQQIKAQALYDGWEIATAGLGMKIQGYGRSSPGREHLTDAQERLYRFYSAWRQRCRKVNMDVRPLVAVLFAGGNTESVDRVYRKRDGWCRQMIIDALEV